MSRVVQFVPKRTRDARANMKEFIRLCREDLTTFGTDLNWNSNHWKKLGVCFANLDQRTRVMDESKALQMPILDFAKAYIRYQQSHRPTKSITELYALRCLERVLTQNVGQADVALVNSGVLDQCAVLARERFSPGVAYQTGRQLQRLGRFLADHKLIPAQLNWRNPIVRPIDTVRTGEKAKAIRDRKLPSEDAVNALADIFARNPSAPRDIFTSSVCAMLMCAPSRISEVLSLSVDCEIWETKRDGESAYGWRFHPGKDGDPLIKWIPKSMESLAQEAIRRIRLLTNEGRRIASWHEVETERFYRHRQCSGVADDHPLTTVDVCNALGIAAKDGNQASTQLRQIGLSTRSESYSLNSLNCWVRGRLPKGFPWLDQSRGVRFSNALFCLRAGQLRSNYTGSPVLLWRPQSGTLNEDLATIEKTPGLAKKSIFDRHGYNADKEKPLRMNSHQFRHLLNTMAQRGGLSQAEIARWSGRSGTKQNRVYDHMSEFELVEMIRSHDPALSLESSLEDMAKQIASKLPISRQEFNSLTIPTAHVTEYGFCVHDFAMLPCQRFRDCLNCTEHVCVKGDHRLSRLKARYDEVSRLKAAAKLEIDSGTAGADRWYEIHELTKQRLSKLIAILESPDTANGSIVRLANDRQFYPARRALEAHKQQLLTSGSANLIGHKRSD